jgi:hypothetical protein
MGRRERGDLSRKREKFAGFGKGKVTGTDQIR